MLGSPSQEYPVSIWQSAQPSPTHGFPSSQYSPASAFPFPQACVVCTTDVVSGSFWKSGRTDAVGVIAIVTVAPKMATIPIPMPILAMNSFFKSRQYSKKSQVFEELSAREFRFGRR